MGSEIYELRNSNLRNNFLNSAFFHRFRIKKREDNIKLKFPNISMFLILIYIVEIHIKYFKHYLRTR